MSRQVGVQKVMRQSTRIYRLSHFKIRFIVGKKASVRFIQLIELACIQRAEDKQHSVTSFLKPLPVQLHQIRRYVVRDTYPRRIANEKTISS